ncbi:MAG: ThuA domain-containing protein [Bryobacteraceae bacterium]
MKAFGNDFSRRRLFRRAGLGLGSGLFGWGASQSQTGGRPKALALIGDRYHNPDYIRVSLDRLFHELDIPIDYTIAYEKLSRDLLKNYQLFLCLRDGMIWPKGYLGPDAYCGDEGLENDFPAPQPQSWITEEQGAAVKEFVQAGGGFYSLHNNSHVSLSSRNYRDVMGGAYIGHPTLRPFKVSVVNRDHPITQGVSDFMVTDEQHFVEFDKDKKYVLLESDNIDGLEYEKYGKKSVAGWAYDYGRGRVVFTAVGHTNHAMWIPAYFELQKRAVKWLLKQL